MSHHNFCHPHNRACGLRGTVTERFWRLSDLTFNTGKQEQFFSDSGQNFADSLPGFFGRST